MSSPASPNASATTASAPFYECMRRREALLAAVLGRQDGDRDLTDLDHLAEVLVTATAGMTPDPARVAETLERLIADADDQAEATMRRIESDDDAVHITTVHSAKGLEYPIVLVPFAYMERPSASRPYVFNDGGRRVVDVASWITWGDGVEEGSRAAGAATTERKRLRHGGGRRRLRPAALRRLHPRQAPPRAVVGADAARRQVAAGTPAPRP